MQQTDVNTVVGGVWWVPWRKQQREITFLYASFGVSCNNLGQILIYLLKPNIHLKLNQTYIITVIGGRW